MSKLNLFDNMDDERNIRLKTYTHFVLKASIRGFVNLKQSGSDGMPHRREKHRKELKISNNI